MHNSKSIQTILSKLEAIIAENKKRGVDPANMPGGFRYEARHGGYLSDYLHNYRQEHRQQLNEYQREYRARYPEKTREQTRRYVAEYRKRKML